MKINNKGKKRGLVLLGISLCLSLIGIKESKAYEFNLKNEQPYDYNYHNNSQLYPFYLGINLDDNKAVFQERGNAKYETTENYTKRDLSSSLQPYELNALYLTTNGKEATKDNLDQRLAMQLYIFERYAKRNNDTINFSFDTSKYHQISDELIKQGQDMIEEKKYSYEVKQGKWTYFPVDWEGTYHIVNNYTFDFREEDGGYYIKADNLGTFTTDINIDQYQENGYYFDSNHYARSNYIEVLKPCTRHTTLEINVVPPKFDINFPSNQVGYDLEIADSSLKNEKVVYNLKIHDGYELKDFKITTKNGTIVKTTDNSFTMPNDDIYINVEVLHKEHNIKVNNIEGITIDCLDKAYVGEKVKVNLNVLDGYKITSLRVNNEEISLDDLTFIMPDGDVFIDADVIRILRNITIANASGIIIDCAPYAYVGDKVKIKLNVLDGYKITSLRVNNEEIDLNDLTFTMPNEDVTIKAITKREHNINIEVNNAKINIKDKGLVGEKISFNYQILDGYEFDKILVRDEFNNDLTVENNSFIMPDDEVYISLITKKKIYQIKTDRDFINVLNEAKVGDLVKIDIKVNNSVIIDDLKVILENGQEIPLKDNSFTMPNSNVTITFKKEKAYKVTFINNMTKEELSKAIYVKNGDTITIPFFEDFDDVTVVTEEPKYISLITPEYTISDSNIYVYYTNFPDDEEDLNEENKYYFEEIPNTYESGFDPLFSLFAVSILVYLKKLLFN